MEIQIFHHTKIQSSKNPVKETKILQDIITLLLIQVSAQAKISSFKNPHIIKIDLIITQGPKSLKLLYSIMNLNTISLPW
jgi:hypothetical protein